MKRIYLDYNATTPVDPRVLDEMLPYFTDKFGNASSVNHKYGWDAEESVSMSREQVARFIGAKPNEIYFTSGATEAINLSLLGVCNRRTGTGNHIISCATEHKAVLDCCQELEKRGFQVTYLKVDENGAIDLDRLKSAITGQTIMVSLMAANNETGVIHPLREISAITKEHGILLMTDATQAIGKIPFNVHDLGVDLAAFSAHKFYGPKGIGGLFVRKNLYAKLSPLFFGGGQEKGMRPGTLNAPGIVGLGKTCEICSEEMEIESQRLRKWRDYLEDELQKLEQVQINARTSPRLPHMTNISIKHIDGSRLIRALKNLALSQGSACTSGTVEPSHVLKAMGHSNELALSSLRIGLGRFTTVEEIDITIESIKDSISKLRLSTT
jgi:cysteine desulfurase